MLESISRSTFAEGEINGWNIEVLSRDGAEALQHLQ